MRRFVATFAQAALAIVLVIVGVVAQRDTARAADGDAIYALITPSQTPDPTFGSAVAAGDVNGDGQADIIVGAPGQNQAHVFSGADGSVLYSLSMPVPMADALFGNAVATGDVNGDGNADVIVGARSESVGFNLGQGRAYVFSGADGSLIRALDPPAPAPYGNFGSAVAAGDVDGDGMADMIVAAAPPDDLVPPAYGGIVYVFSGADGSLMYSLGADYLASAPLLGQYGTGVAAGDIDGDGKAEVAVGGWAGSYYPMPYVAPWVDIFSGADGSVARRLRPPVYARFDVWFGSRLAMGDVDGNGSADVIVGDPGVGAGVAGPAAYIFGGADGSLIYTLTNPNPNPDGVPRFGAAVAAGDVDGDGRADAIVGTLPDPSTSGSRGRVYVFSGADGSLLDTINSRTADVQWGDWFGTAVAAGQVSGNGQSEVVIGAPDASYSAQGWTYVFAHESDGDGCADAKELQLVPPTDPFNPWDFFSVPVPALFTAQYPALVFRDGAVSASDADAVFAYFGAGATAGTPLYEQDLNGNGVKDGIEYDRSVAGPAHSGPPDGAIRPQDAQLAFAQSKLGYDCRGAR